MKIALVHDDFCQLGGAERLFEEIAKIYPDSPIYTSLVDWKKSPTTIAQNRVRPSFLQKIPFANCLYKPLLPLYPLAFEAQEFSKYEVVLSSTTRFAKSIVTKPNTIHICYTNSIPRFLYDKEKSTDYLPSWAQALLKPYFNWLRRWDQVASSRPDFYIANSENVRKQIKKFYGRDAAVVHPFAATDFFKPSSGSMKQSNNQTYFLVVSRLVKWKKIDIAIKAAIDSSVSLKIVGDGPDKNRLMTLASNQAPGTRHQVQFLGWVDREELRELYRNAKALIVTQDEDFGIAAVEAQASGIPVIAYKAGGSEETVIEGKTGVFYSSQDPTSLKDAIAVYSKIKWVSADCHQNALRFSPERFKRELKSQVTKWTQSPPILK